MVTTSKSHWATAKRAGPSCIQSLGVRAFLGFDDKLGWPAKAANPTRDAIVAGLDCLFSQSHDIDCAASQMRRGFLSARADYENNGRTHYGLTAGETDTAWLFAKSNGGSIRVVGDASAT
jgi:hypothetical protein